MKCLKNILKTTIIRFLHTCMYIALCIVVFTSCESEKQRKKSNDEKKQIHQQLDANVHMHRHGFRALLKKFENPNRSKWQKPEEVIAMLGDLEGRIVADIGAGSGYFAFRLNKAGATVFALDIDEQFIGYMDSVIAAKALTDIQTRLVPEDDPELQPNEIDHVIIVNTYHHIHDRKVYFSKVLNALKPGGKLMVVDFHKREIPFGPPVEMKLDYSKVLEELRQTGFNDFVTDTITLQYQYIISGIKH